MITTTKKLSITRWLVALLCCGLVLPALAQRGGGGGGGGFGGGGGGFGGGGGGRGGGGFGGGGTAGGASSTSPYAANGQIPPVTFTIDPVTGSIIYITDDVNQENVKRALEAMDQVKPQVLIKVVFLEVTYNRGLDLGVEGGLTQGFNGKTVTASNLFGLAAQGLTPTTGITTLPGAGLYTIAGDQFSATLRAISEKGKVEILSRPTILARHGQPAEIVVGQRVPLITSVSFDSFGRETSGISYQNVGIILDVTPFIYPNGNVEMILEPQISEVAPNQSTQISSGTNGNFSTPYINTRSANTVVITPDGQTVVIGGLMQDSKSSTDTKVPILGDIPLLGNLFKHKVSSIAKTELIVFVTPFVVKTPGDLARMSVDETSRTVLSPKAFPQKERDTYIDPSSPISSGAPSPETAVPPHRKP